jgi:hypothetical protein
MKKIFLLLLAFISIANAQIIDVNFTGGGSTSYSSWSNVNSFNYSGYGSFPGSQAWPSPIKATDGSTNSTLNKISNSPTGGGAFLASDSIYFGSFTQVTNASGGTLRLSNSVSLTNLKTLVFQIQIGEVTGYDFYQTTGYPKLSLNNGISLMATFTNLVNRFQNGTYPSPQTGLDEPVYINTWAYQWNIFSPTNINSYNIDFSAVTHSQVYALRWDSTSILQNQVVPEPSTYILLGLALFAFVMWKIWKSISK